MRLFVSRHGLRVPWNRVLFIPALPCAATDTEVTHSIELTNRLGLDARESRFKHSHPPSIREQSEMSPLKFNQENGEATAATVANDSLTTLTDSQSKRSKTVSRTPDLSIGGEPDWHSLAKALIDVAERIERQDRRLQQCLRAALGSNNSTAAAKLLEIWSSGNDPASGKEEEEPCA